MPTDTANPFGARATLRLGDETATVYRLPELDRQGLARLDRLPFSIRVLLENALRHAGRGFVTDAHVRDLAAWSPTAASRGEVPFMPARVVLQDFTGVPCVVDLAAMRDAMGRMKGDPDRINPVVPCDLVIDHSVQVDSYGSERSLRVNVELEFDRNRERYQLLKFAQRAFDSFRVVPPGTGIVHQVNLEHLAPVVQLRPQFGELTAYPDTLVGTDSHTTMINGLGVLGWGVGGIEAEAVMLGQPYFMLVPEVIGMKLVGELPLGTTATDLVLTVTQMLRKKGVVDKFVEFYGPGLSALGLADRATIANMAPEYGATMGFFPVDAETVRYLERTGRGAAVCQRVERYAKEQGLFRTDATPDPRFSDTIELDLSTVEPSLAGPRRPQDRVPLREAKRSFRTSLVEMLDKHTQALDKNRVSTWIAEGGSNAKAEPHPQGNGLGKLVQTVPVSDGRVTYELPHGAVVIAAITSCTNTSNPSVMLGAGLLAKKAVERGLSVKPWVKTSLAPGSKVVTEYLRDAGLQPYLDALGFHVVGYGCTTCIGNSGPLPDSVSEAVRTGDLVVAGVLSGNRNFEGRINPQVRMNYLASPPLVVAYAIAGEMDLDLGKEPLGRDRTGEPVYLKDVWPTQQEIREAIAANVKPEQFQKSYGEVFVGDEEWRGLKVPDGDTYVWDDSSTYVRKPPFFDSIPAQPKPLADIAGARVLALLGDSVTTDHISPAGSIAKTSPAAKYLIEHGVEPKDFNSYGARRGNHEVMMRGTFANIRLKNLLVPGTEGGVTVHMPSGDDMTIYDASMRYQADGVPLVVVAGAEYGTGSSRDWAAKGTLLLGVKAVIAKSFERIHRSNLAGMGILPLQLEAGEDAQTLGLTGKETFEVHGIAEGLAPKKKLTVVAKGEGGASKTFTVTARLDTPNEVDYYRHGGILTFVLRQLAKPPAERASAAS
jgi:aconitate hydratase